MNSLFFAIQISDDQVEAALWKVEEGKTHIVSFSQPHHWRDEQSCVTAVDQSLQELGKESEHVKESLFALNGDWVDPEGIIAAKKHLFQQITKELTLEPIGFVVMTEALAEYINDKSPQLNAFLVQAGTQNLVVTLVRAGEVIQTVKVGKSEKSVSDLTEAFAHIKEKLFPSKIILFSPVLSQEELTEVQQQLFSHDWVGSYPFLHQPVIEVFEEKSLLEVVVETGGKAVAQSRGLLKKMETAVPIAKPTPPVTAQPETNANVMPISAGEFGFHQPEPVKEVAAPAAKSMPSDHHQQTKEILHFAKKPFWKAHLPFILLGFLIGLIALAAITFFAAQKIMTAVVSVKLASQTVSQDVQLTLDAKTASSDPTKLILKADLASQLEEGDQSADTTGTKTIGDKAKGSITIYSYTVGSKTFAAGTKLSAGNVSFILDKDTTVASASTSLDSSNNMVIKPGTGDGTITASAIGSDSNIASGTDLTVESFAKTVYSAKTTSAITGGSSRDIQAVSQKDKDTLLASLKKMLVDKAAKDLKAQSVTGLYAVPTNRVKIDSAVYSADVGKETNTISLYLKLEAEALTYKASELKSFADQILSQKLPSGYALSGNDPQILSSPSLTSTSSAQIVLQSSFSSIARPVVDVNQWRSAIVGRSEQQALSLLQSDNAIKSVAITLKPFPFSLLFHNLPKVGDKITFEVDK